MPVRHERDRNMKKNRSSLPHQPAQDPLPGYEIPEASRPSPINRVSQNRPGRRKSSLPFSLFSAVRIGLQILFFIWLPALYILAFSGLEQLVFSISAGKFSFSALWPVLIPLLAILAVSVFAGRFFCGWMCAFGALTDWVYRIFSRWTRGKIRLARTPDRLLKYLKYAVLAVLLALGIFVGSVSVSAWSPWDAFGMLFTVGYAPAISFVLKSLLPGLILLILTLLASAFIERFFCRYLCPMGAFFALTAGGRFIYIDKPTEKCGKCRICTKSCAMQIPLYQMDKVKSTECISCMKCVEVCPRNNVHVTAFGHRVNPIALAAAAVILTAGIYSSVLYMTDRAAVSQAETSQASSILLNGISDTSAAGTTPPVSASASGTTAAASSDTAPSAAASETAATQSSAQGLYKDGTYQGTGTGYRGGTTTVEVTIQNGQISNISAISNQDTPEYFTRAFGIILDEILSAQNTNVDVVSQATYSSSGIIEAVSNALSQAQNG